MAEYTLEAEVRTITGKKVKTLRKQGIVPITVYGPKTETVSLQVIYRPLEVALMKAGGTNLIDIVAGGKTHVVLARDVQRDVVRGDILHVDFLEIDATEKIRADIPIHLIGESPVVASRAGILLTGTNNITIEAFPDKLRDSIEVDLSGLTEIGMSISVGDLDLGEGTEIINDPDDLIVRVSQTSAARAAADLEAQAETSTGAEPEVISRGKDEDEE